MTQRIPDEAVQRAVRKAVDEALGEKLYESWAQRGSPVWGTRTANAISDAVLDKIPGAVFFTDEEREAMLWALSKTEGQEWRPPGLESARAKLEGK